jgi:hypothetical protein
MIILIFIIYIIGKTIIKEIKSKIYCKNEYRNKSLHISVSNLIKIIIIINIISFFININIIINFINIVI